MDLQLIKKGLNFTKRKKKWVVFLAVLGVTGYTTYRVYNSPSIVRKRIRVLKLINALFTISENVCDSAELIGIISRDLRVFLQSDSDELPQSLKQVVKLVNSDEFSDSVVRVTAAFTRGVFKGYEGGIGSGSGSNSGFYERFMDTLFSDAGSGFVSVVAGSFARNLVTALWSGENYKRNVDSPSWFDVMSSERGRELISEVVHTFVSTAVAVYLDKTMTVNTYDELFAGMTNPKHEKPVREMLVALCNNSIETFVKTSHEVLTNSGSSSESGKLSRLVVTRSDSDVSPKTYYTDIDETRNVISVKQNDEDGNSSSGDRPDSWVSTVSSTLAVPSNRKLVLDVTGRVTFETVRSFLEFLVGKFLTNVKRSFGAVNDAIVETGLGVVRYFTAKSTVVASICLSLCLHVLGGPWALMLA